MIFLIDFWPSLPARRGKRQGGGNQKSFLLCSGNPFAFCPFCFGFVSMAPFQKYPFSGHDERNERMNQENILCFDGFDGVFAGNLS